MTQFNYFFKAKLSIFMMAILFAGILHADEVKYNDNWGAQGFELKDQKSSGVNVNYSIQSFTLSENEIDGEMMNVVELPGNLLQNDEGAPNLPGTGRYIAIPQGATIELNIVGYRTEKFSNVELAPAPRIPWESEKGPLEYAKNNEIYMKDAFYPANPVLVSEVTHVRGVDVVMLGITPFQYNPVTKELIVYKDIEVEVDFIGGNGHFGEDRLRSRWWDPILSDMLLNSESLPKMDYGKSHQATDDTGCEYLIVVPNDPFFSQWADSIKNFRTQQGILTDIKTIDDIGGNNVNTLENYFNNAFSTWDIVPAAVLLIGDYGTSVANTIISPIWDNYCASDNIFADVNNNDMPDMVFARMTAQNEAQLEVMVTKFLNYERTPPTNPDFYNHPVTALGWQTERWFQICSETVGGFWREVQGKEPVRINAVYQGSPGSTWSTATNTAAVLSYFGPDGLGYIPAQPSELGGWTGGTASGVNNAINSGAFMLQHRDHGYEQGWGEPDYSSSDISGLTNTDLCFVWSINCLTGKYNMSGECFTEKFHRYTYNGENSGALAVNAASEISYSFVNDTYVWGCYDNMWPDFMPDYGTTPAERGILPAFGSAAGKYFLQQSSWPYNTNNKEVTYNLFHHHGDAFTVVYSEVPQNLNVTHNPILYAGVTSFDITVDEGAFIALTVNGEIIGTAESTGSPLSITIPGQIPPDMLLVTITKQNYYRYESLVEIIPAAGPYVVQQSVEMNDDLGNGNGIMETGESIVASMTVENVGVEDGENIEVTISSTDEYVTITDGFEEYGTVAAGSSVLVEDGFAWDVANNIPDMHMVNFEVNASNGTDTWTTYFAKQGHGPSLEVGTMTIDDSQGNGNGRLDPGEDVFLTVETYNNGSFDAIETVGTLSCSNGYITINSASYDLNIVGAGLMEEAIYSVSVAAGTPIGTTVSFMYDVISGGYSTQENFATSVGLIVEDWETGDMGSYDWTTSGSADWAVSNDNPYEGAYCVKSGNINDQQSTSLLLDYEVFSDDEISFWFKVSSEGNYDFLTFYIDGNAQGSWAGEVGWQEETYPVSAGMHTFKWEFDKDQSVSSGGDCAWVDFIMLPAAPTTTAYAGSDALICEGDNYQCDGIATLYNAVNWSTTGTGVFDDSQSLTAVYTPSDDDISNGSVVLTLTAYGPDSDVEDPMTLSIFESPTAFAGDDAITCSDGLYEIMDAAAENYVSVAWTTSGDGMFSDEYIINPTYTPGTMDMEAGYAILTFTVLGIESCGDVMDDLMLTVEMAATVDAGGDMETCSDEAVILSSAIAENYSSMIWSTTGDGVFDDDTAMNPEYMPGPEDEMNSGATLMLTAIGNGSCPEVNSEMTVMVYAVAMADAGGDDEINSEETYTLTNAVAENYDMVIWSTDGDGTFDDANAVNPVYSPGSNDINDEGVTLTLIAENENCGDIMDEMVLAINPLGLYENMANFDLSIFPNPNTGQFTLQLNGESNELVNIKMYSALGEIVYENENVRIDGSYSETLNLNVEQGVYYLRIEGKELLTNQKIIIQK